MGRQVVAGKVGRDVCLQGQSVGQVWVQAVAGHVSADDVAGADQKVGLPLGD